MLSVSIDRTSLSLSALVITDLPGATYRLPEDGMGRPAIAQRRTYAGNSAWLNGSTLISATKEQASLPLVIYTEAASSATLDTQMTALEAALGQFVYNVTVTVDGVAKVWRGDPADISWGEVDSGLVRAKMCRASVTIPVYPIPGA